MTFESAGLRVYGMLGLPDRAEPGRRAVILLHGWSGYRIGPHRMLVRMARRFPIENSTPQAAPSNVKGGQADGS